MLSLKTSQKGKKMLTDSFFQQGATHEICEDYALNGSDYVIVSDGCSNGGGPHINTDWGARILTKAAEQHIKCLLDPMVFMNCVIGTAVAQCSIFPNLSPECLTATLLVAHRMCDTFCTFMIGDGVMGARLRNGGWDIHVYNAVKGGTTNAAAPFYLKYNILEEEIVKYCEMFGGMYSHYFFRGGIKDQIATETRQEIVRLDPKKPYFFNRFPVEKYDLVFIGSDGIGSFYNTINTGTSKHNCPRSELDALGVLLDFTIRPNFLRIQRQWAWKRSVEGTFLKRNWHNADDVSLAAIYVE